MSRLDDLIPNMLDMSPDELRALIRHIREDSRKKKTAAQKKKIAKEKQAIPDGSPEPMEQPNETSSD